MTGSHFVETHRKLFYCGGSCREHLASERRTRKNTHLQSTYVSSTVQDKVTYIKKKEGGGARRKELVCGWVLRLYATWGKKLRLIERCQVGVKGGKERKRYPAPCPTHHRFFFAKNRYQKPETLLRNRRKGQSNRETNISPEAPKREEARWERVLLIRL
jgi:hypothetical protein